MVKRSKEQVADLCCNELLHFGKGVKIPVFMDATDGLAIAYVISFRSGRPTIEKGYPRMERFYSYEFRNKVR